MSWRPLIRPGTAEHTQNAVWGHNGPFLPGTDLPWFDVGGRRQPPELPFVEYDPILGGWWQGDRRLRNFRPKKYFTRPHDGKRAGALGRLKDALTCEGADVFVTLSGSKRTLMRDRPQRWQWTHEGITPELLEEWDYDKDHRLQDEMPPIEAFWTTNRLAKPDYNFRTRRFERPNPRWLNPNHFWSDARWPAGAKHSSDYPLSKKSLIGRWQTRVPWPGAGFHPGGRPRHPD